MKKAQLVPSLLVHGLAALCLGFAVAGCSALSTKHRVITIVTTVATGGGIEIFANGAETINGVTNQNIYNQYDSLTIVSDGTAWYIIAAMP